jgi:hypothetical protein
MLKTRILFISIYGLEKIGMDIGAVMYWLENARNQVLFGISKLLAFFCKLLVEDYPIILILDAILRVLIQGLILY